MYAKRDVAVLFCKHLYTELCDIGYYPALTGGQLYKEEERKDIDIIIYRNRQKITKFETIDIEKHLINIGVTNIKYYGFVTKCNWRGYEVDILNPETTILSEEDYQSLSKLTLDMG